MPTATVNGMKLSYDDSGSGLPVLFVHGFPLSRKMWRHQLAGFSNQYRVIAPDLRGFGDSDVTQGTVTMAQLADDLAGLLDALEITERVVVCGLSMGGYVAWQFQQLHGDRLRTLIQCDTKAVADTPEGVEKRHRMAKTVMEHGSEAIATAMLPNLFSPVTSERQQAAIDEMRQTILNTSPHGIAAAALGMAERPDVTPQLSSIDVPTLLIVGEDDQISTVDEMQGIAEAMPQAQLVTVPDAGHMSPLENPEKVNAAIREFLESL